MLSSHSRSLPARHTLLALSTFMGLLLPLVLLSGCTFDAANQPVPTPVSTTAIQSHLPGPRQTPNIPSPVPSNYVAPPPVPTRVPTFAPAATYTPAPTNTSGPTFTATPSPIPLTNPVPDPHQQGVQYFSQTGHTLRGVFLDYWKAHGGAGQLGYPITEAFVEYPISGGTNDLQDNPLDNSVMPVVQYFQNARLAIPSGLPLPSDTPTSSAATLASVQETAGGEQIARQKGYFDGLYPRYGYALDFSWIAGIYDGEFVYCDLCGRCPRVFFALKNIYRSAVVLPYGPAWDIALTAMQDTLQAQVKGSGYPFMVIFGKPMGDIVANPYGNANNGDSCASTKYQVERAQPNPIRKTIP